MTKQNGTRYTLERKNKPIKSVGVTLNEDEKDVVDWHIIDFVDFEKGNLLGKCSCGKSLRFMFTVQHTKTGLVQLTVKVSLIREEEFLCRIC